MSGAIHKATQQAPAMTSQAIDRTTIPVQKVYIVAVSKVDNGYILTLDGATRIVASVEDLAENFAALVATQALLG